MTAPAHEQCGADAAAYALGALEEQEARAFEAHLDTCAVCRDELVAFRQVAGALAIAAPQHPAPKRLRRRVLSRVRKQTARPTRRAPLFTGRRSGLALGALATLALVTVGGIALSSSSTPRARVIAAQVSTPPGTAELRLSGGHAELIVRHMPQPRAGDIYEVWLQRTGGQPKPTSALFGVTTGGNGDVDVPGNISRFNRVMVTEEQAGGSSVPHGNPVIVAPIRT